MRHRKLLQKLVLTACAFISCLPGTTGGQARGQSLARADRLETQAKLLYDGGHFDDAIRLELQVLGIRTRILGPIHPDVAVGLDNLAAMYEDTGNYARAEQLLDLASQIAERTLPPEHPYATRFLYDQASMYDDRGDYRRAKELYQRVLLLREKLVASRPIDAGLSRLCKATSTAPECQEQLDVALALNDLAAVCEHENDYDQAEQLFNRALELSEKLLPPEDPFIAKLLNNLAVVYDDKDDKPRAEALFKRVLAIRQQVLGENHPKVALSLNNLAALYVRKGDLANAEKLLNRALEIARQALPAEHLDVGLILGNLAALATAKGEPERAVQWLTQASVIQEHHLSLILAIGSEKQKQLYLDSLINDTNQAVSLHAISAPRDDAAAQLALATILQRKGRTLDAMTDQFNALRRNAAPHDRRLLYRLQAVGTRLANRLVSGPARIQLQAKWRAEITRDEAEVERLEGEIGRRSEAFRLRALPLTIEAVREQIPDDAALIEFFEYLPFNPRAGNVAARWGEPHYVAYVVRHNLDVPLAVELGAAAPIDERVKRLRAALRNPARPDSRELAQAVDACVMQPIRRMLGDTRRLILSPDGALNLIPFAALVDEHGQYLVEGYSLTYLTSGRDLLRLREQAANQHSHNRPLIVADPSYDMTGAPAGRDPTAQTLQLDENRRPSELALPKFVPLRGTREEAIALGELLPDARVLTQTQATESALKRVRGPSLLHVATHGFFLPNDQPPPAALGSEARMNSERDPAPVPAGANENPLLRAGLALSGANNLRGGQGEDGILTGLEAAGLNLLGTKLVVLSACETGVGDVQNGNGVYGLRRALVLAGSESQLITLWKVNDESTRDFMIRYYNLLLTGRGRSEALRQVQLEMIADKDDSLKQSHPYFWASFIQSGEWKNLAGRDVPLAKLGLNPKHLLGMTTWTTREPRMRTTVFARLCL